VNISRFQHEPMPRFTQIVYVFGNPQFIAESVLWESEGGVSKTQPILLGYAQNTHKKLQREQEVDTS